MEPNAEPLNRTTAQIIEIIIVHFQYDCQAVLKSNIDHAIWIWFLIMVNFVVAFVNVPRRWWYIERDVWHIKKDSKIVAEKKKSKFLFAPKTRQKMEYLLIGEKFA